MAQKRSGERLSLGSRPKKKYVAPDFEPSHKSHPKIVAGVLVLAVLAVSVFYLSSITGFTTFPSAGLDRPALVSYFGGEPKIDGISSPNEWADAGVVASTYEGGNVWIYSKHDKQNLFFLVQWQDENPSWNYAPRFYFEQDDYSFDGVLDGRNDYSFYIPIEKCYDRGDSASYGSYQDRWVEYAASDATVDCGFDQPKELWTLEIKKPLRNNDLKLLALQIADTTKPYNLGFAVINWQNRVEGGVAAESWQWPYDQKLSGSAPGSYTVPGDTTTWGALNVVWTRKPTSTK